MAAWARGWAAVAILTASAGPAGAQEAGGGPILDDPTLVALAVALAVADAPEVRGAPAAPGDAHRAGGPELELVASVKARTLMFEEVPTVDVLFHGSGPRRTVWRTERRNLPPHPEPGVVYHDVSVRLTITSSLEELSSLLREAKRAARGVRIDGSLAPVGGSEDALAPPPRAAAAVARP